MRAKMGMAIIESLCIETQILFRSPPQKQVTHFEVRRSAHSHGESTPSNPALKSKAQNENAMITKTKADSGRHYKLQKRGRVDRRGTKDQRGSKGNTSNVTSTRSVTARSPSTLCHDLGQRVQRIPIPNSIAIPDHRHSAKAFAPGSSGSFISNSNELAKPEADRRSTTKSSPSPAVPSRSECRSRPPAGG